MKLNLELKPLRPSIKIRPPKQLHNAAGHNAGPQVSRTNLKWPFYIIHFTSDGLRSRLSGGQLAVSRGLAINTDLIVTQNESLGLKKSRVLVQDK